MLSHEYIQVNNVGASAPQTEKFNEGGAREFLSQNKWPIGLQYKTLL